MANTNHLTPLGGYSDAGAQMLRKMSENATLLTDFLRFQGRVFKHPASIALEFFTQKPDAAFIATAAQWEKAGFTLTPGSEAIRFFDEHGKTIEMFDFSQCEDEAPPMIWAVTNQNLAAVKEGMGIPAESKLIDGLVEKSVDSELIVNAMQMLNVPPQNHAAFQRSMVSSVAQIIAGRLSVNGGNFRVQTDNSAFRSLKSTEQRMIFLAIAGKAARGTLRQIENIVTETSVQAMLAEQEAKNAELRRMAESQRGAEDESDGRGTAADSGRSPDESPDRIESGEAGRRDGLDNHAGNPERLADAVVSGVQAEESERDSDVVPVQSDERDIRAASGGRAVDGTGTDRQLRDGVDALHGGQSSGTGGSDADEAQLDHALYYLREVARLDDRERDWYTEDLKKLRSHPLLSDAGKVRIDAFLSPEKAAELSPAAKYIMNEDNIPMFADRMVARDEMDDIAHRILDNGEDAAAVAQDFVDASRYIISDHETFDLATFAAKKDTEGVTLTAEPDSAHPFTVAYSWEQFGEFFRTAAQLHWDIEREAEEAWERDAAENMEVYDALDHHRDVYLRDTCESEGSGYITNARKQDFYNYRLHFDPDQGYLLMADSDREDDLIIRNFTMVGSAVIMHSIREMGFEVTGVEPAFTYDLYQLKSGEEHHFHRFETLSANRYAHLTHEDYDLVYSGDLRDIEGDTVQQKLNALFERFNTDHPADFFGRSMSTSDVVVVTEGSGRTPYYVQPVGFEVMSDFFANKYDLIDLKFTGNPQGFNAIKVAARTDSFEDTGETNMLIADTQVFYARLSENAALADVRKVIQTAQENGCYLTGDSVAYLTERFGVDFMPEMQPVDTVLRIPETDVTVDIAAVGHYTLTNTYDQYEGGIDSDGHERKDNFSQQSESYTYTYLGSGIVEEEYYSTTQDFPSSPLHYNLYDSEQRERLVQGMLEFARQSENLTTHIEPKQQPAPERNFVLVLNDNNRQIQFGEVYDTLEAAQDAGNDAIHGGQAIG